MRHTTVVLATVIALSTVLTSCASPSHPSENKAGPGRYATNGTFTMVILDDPGGVDPYRSPAGPYAVQQAYDSLVNQQPDGTFVSGLAEKWKADAHSAKFILRPNITCSDGTPLTASHVANAINFVSNPKNQSTLYGIYVPAKPMTAEGDDSTRTVAVTLPKDPFGFLLNTVGLLPIMCPKGLKDPSAVKSATDGTGPYVLSKVSPGQSYTFTIRKDYAWGPGGQTTKTRGLPSHYVVRVIRNETTAANLLLSGDLNFAQIAGQDRQRLEAKGLKHIDVPSSDAWLFLNHRNGRPNADKLVRQALVAALNRDEIVKVSTSQKGTAATGLVSGEPKACTGDTNTGLLPPYNVDAASVLLDRRVGRRTQTASATKTANHSRLSCSSHHR